MTQRNLWDAPPPADANTPGLARTSAPPTSRSAAVAIAPVSGALRMRVLQYVAERADGATCDEIEEALSMRHQTAAARLRELETGGHVYTSGKRPTRSGRQANIYHAMTSAQP